MDLPPVETYRHKVYELLEECVSQKLLYGGTSNAIALAQTAYDLATMNSVPSPWPEFAAYRLAHLKMRSGKHSIEELREIDRLFERSNGSEKVGPIPLIYRLAVLHRLVQSLTDVNEIAHVHAKFDEVYDKALKRLRSIRYDSEVPIGDRIERQSAAFNMLEFATYMSGKAYQSLEGDSSLSSMDPFRKGTWFVVGRDVAKIKMTEEMARWEFEDRASKNPDSILIELPTQVDAKICVSRNREWSDWNSDCAKLVLLLLQDNEISKVDLKRKVVGTDGESAEVRFRQAKSRAKKKIVQMLGKSALEVFEGDRLSEKIPVLGLVHSPAFR
jgi:hypothetical protein